MLDLHGCQTADVVDRVDKFIYQAMQNGKSRVRIMTGKGTGLVKKTVITYLKQGNYPWHYEKLKTGKPNEGILVVILA